jgi:imidazolonepropionase-like amidohydrolase
MRPVTRPTKALFTHVLVALALVVLSGCARRQQMAAEPEPTAQTPSSPVETGPSMLLRGGRVMTATGVTYERGDVLVVGDRIAAVGIDLEVPAGATVVDTTGKTVTPGLVDPHSHIGVSSAPALRAHNDINEMVGPVTAYVRAEDAFWPQDPQIERARAGGITTLHVLPGSANLIGGRTLVIKTYPNARTVDDARFPGAPEGLKMAVGENPKRVYEDKGGPATRMGNMAGIRKTFEEAVEYRRKWQRYHDELERHRSGARDDDESRPPEPPARDFGLETLTRVLRGEILVHPHCYRADEMVLLMDLAESYGFRIRGFHHAVEAYKVADRLAAHGAAALVWADWWGFKAEAYDGIPENAAMVAAAGARAMMHSDNAILIQRMNQEAAKAMYAGRRAGLPIDEDEALRWITLNPAWALGVDDRIGSIEPGKHADLVVWNRSPFSVYAKVEKVYIEGEPVYDREETSTRPESDFELGQPAAHVTAPAATPGGAK